MLIDNDPHIQTITPAQIIKVCYPSVVAQTEAGDTFVVKLSAQERQDPLFWEAITNVAQAGLWVPVGERYHQLLSYDWMLVTH